MATSKLVKIGGLLGLGLVGLGAYLVYRQQQAQRMAGFAGGSYRQVFGTFAEAPVIDSFSDGDMMTEIRASDHLTIEQRIASIQKLIYKSVQDPQMRKLAFQITRHCPERDGTCEAKAIYKAIKKRIRYNGDIAPIKHPDGSVDGIDLYQHARRTWELSGGDCDDAVILAGTLLALNGITPKLRVTAEDDGEDSHIYPVALLPKFEPTYAVALDTTLPGSFRFGIEAPAYRVTDYDA